MQLCDRDGIPLLFLHNVTGFMVGTRVRAQRDHQGRGEDADGPGERHRAEAVGARATPRRAPATTRWRAGPGSRASCSPGRTRARRSWAPSRRSKTLTRGAGRQPATRRATSPTPEELARIASEVGEYFERRSDPYHLTSELRDDGLIDPIDTRNTLGMALSAALNAPIERTPGGVLPDLEPTKRERDDMADEVIYEVRRRRRLADDQPPGGAQRAEQGGPRRPLRRACESFADDDDGRRADPHRGRRQGVLRRRRSQGDGRHGAEGAAEGLPRLPQPDGEDRQADDRRGQRRRLRRRLPARADGRPRDRRRPRDVRDHRGRRSAAASPWASPLPWIVGPRVAMEILLDRRSRSPPSARTSSASSTGSCRSTQLLEEAEAMARAIADNAPLSVRAAKRMVYVSADARLGGRPRRTPTTCTSTCT